MVHFLILTTFCVCVCVCIGDRETHPHLMGRKISTHLEKADLAMQDYRIKLWLNETRALNRSTVQQGW